MSTTTIILTATANVNLKKYCIFQTDCNERVETYLKSVLQWLHKTKFNIILVDNSGYTYEELNMEKELFKDRFEVITFIEKELEETEYLRNDDSKGTSEIFSINYAFFNSTIIKQSKSNFIIKVTARFFIPELEEYLSNYDLNNYDCLVQNDRYNSRCEMVGSHYKNFYFIFCIYFMMKDHRLEGQAEHIYEERTACFRNRLICKSFDIEKTQRGGIDMCFTTI